VPATRNVTVDDVAVIVPLVFLKVACVGCALICAGGAGVSHVLPWNTVKVTLPPALGEAPVTVAVSESVPPCEIAPFVSAVFVVVPHVTFSVAWLLLMLPPTVDVKFAVLLYVPQLAAVVGLVTCRTIDFPAANVKLPVGGVPVPHTSVCDGAVPVTAHVIPVPVGIDVPMLDSDQFTPLPVGPAGSGSLNVVPSESPCPLLVSVSTNPIVPPAATLPLLSAVLLGTSFGAFTVSGSSPHVLDEPLVLVVSFEAGVYVACHW